MLKKHTKETFISIEIMQSNKLIKSSSVVLMREKTYQILFLLQHFSLPREHRVLLVYFLRNTPSYRLWSCCGKP